MKHLLRTLMLGVILGFILNGCVKQPETIVINEDPETPDTARVDKDTVASGAAAAADFRQLVIGEIHPISTLDPLFADNNSVRRTLQILYEGLVRFDQTGKVVPAISKRWSVSDDSLRYSFTLRNNVYFHDSDIFNNGIGRKVVASDFRYAIERMAKIDVPDDAAKLFMSVRGFEPYYEEQHNVLNPAYRELGGVSGISTPNDSTLILSLIEKDSHLLQKLASPYAVAYPREAVGSSPAVFAPVGSGPFQLSQRRGDSTYIFARYNEYWDAGNNSPNIDRVDVRVERNESQLFRAMAGKEIHLIPQLGPNTLESMLTPSGELQPAYTENYVMTVPGGETTYSLNYYAGSDESEEAVRTLFSSLDLPQLFSGIPPALFSDTYSVSVQEGSGAPSSDGSTLYSTYSEDPFQQWVLSRISSQLGGGRTIQMFRIRTPSRQTALYTNSFIPMFEGDTAERNDGTLLQFSAKQTVLAIRQIENLEFNRYPWWINLRTVDLPGIDQL